MDLPHSTPKEVKKYIFEAFERAEKTCTSPWVLGPPPSSRHVASAMLIPCRLFADTVWSSHPLPRAVNHFSSCLSYHQHSAVALPSLGPLLPLDKAERAEAVSTCWCLCSQMLTSTQQNRPHHPLRAISFYLLLRINLVVSCERLYHADGEYYPLHEQVLSTRELISDLLRAITTKASPSPRSFYFTFSLSRQMSRKERVSSTISNVDGSVARRKRAAPGAFAGSGYDQTRTILWLILTIAGCVADGVPNNDWKNSYRRWQ